MAETDGILKRIAKARNRLAMGELSAGGLILVAVVALSWAAAAAVEAMFRLPSAGRLLLLGSVAVAGIGVLVWKALVPLARWAGWLPGLSNDVVATRIGRTFPEVRDRLLNLLQLMDGRHSAAPQPLVEAAAARLDADMAAVPVEQVEDFGAVRRAARLALLPVAGLVLFGVIGGSTFLEASTRLLSPLRTFEQPLPFRVQVTPGDAAVIKGADVEIRADFSGAGWPEETRIEYRFEGETVNQQIGMTAPPEARHTFVNVRTSIHYRVLAGRLESQWFTLEVTDRPVIARLSTSLRYPSYTRLPAARLPDNDGTVTALLGTRVLVDAVVTGPEVAEGRIVFASGRSEPLTGQGRTWSGAFTVRGDDSWHVELISHAGVANAEPIRYRIRATRDSAPSIVFLAPEPSVDLDESAAVDVAWSMSDDYGFSGLGLHYRLDESRFGEPSDSFMVMQLPLPDPYQLEQTGAVRWSLAQDTGLDPVPGDVFTYYLQVADNNRYSGASTARTALYRLRMPSLAERYEALDQTEDRTEEGLEDLVEEARRIREQFDELRDELRSKTESEWQDERALEQLMEEQQSLEEQADQVAQQIEELTQEMAENDLVSEETLQMFEELREVAEEINTPELMDALRDLQNAMEQMNLQQMQEAMEQFDFSEQLYQQRMERTLELFKNLRVQQDLEEAARRAEELADTEERLAEETEPLAEEQREGAEQESAENQQEQDTPRGEELAQQQERAAEEMRQLEEKLEEIAERMEELKKAPDEAMDELSDDTRQQEMPQQMQENAEQMRNGDFQKAQQGQQQMSQNLRSLQQNLQQMQQGMQGQQMQMNMAGLRRALDDVLGLSNDQEMLRAEVQQLAADSPQLRATAQQQTRLQEGLNVVADSLQSLSRSIPQMTRDVQVHAGEAMREMGDATQAMTDRAARRASGHQKGAMTHLNELALMLADMLDQMMNGQGSGGSMSMEQFMQQLQNMSGQQQMLNQQIQQMLNDMQGNRLTQDMQQRLRQLGGQQEKIRQDLRQLSRERSLKNQALGDLERIAEQMQETIEELQQQRVSRRTVQRQQQILTRLLEASRSMQERGRERKRESESADQILRNSPAELSPSERADQLRRDLIRALERGYAPDYEDLIRRYFELLTQQESGGN